MEVAYRHMKCLTFAHCFDVPYIEHSVEYSDYEISIPWAYMYSYHSFVGLNRYQPIYNIHYTLYAIHYTVYTIYYLYIRDSIYFQSVDRYVCVKECLIRIMVTDTTKRYPYMFSCLFIIKPSDLHLYYDTNMSYHITSYVQQ
jgi:hypothetical protein